MITVITPEDKKLIEEYTKSEERKEQFLLMAQENQSKMVDLFEKLSASRISEYLKERYHNHIEDTIIWNKWYNDPILPIEEKEKENETQRMVRIGRNVLAGDLEWQKGYWDFKCLDCSEREGHSVHVEDYVIPGTNEHHFVTYEDRTKILEIKKMIADILDSDAVFNRNPEPDDYD